MPNLSAYAPLVLSILRIMAGLLFMQHGLMKHFDFPGPFPMDMAPPDLPMIAGWIELSGGFLIAFGLFTRPAAFIASGTMAAAYFIGHAGNGFWPILNQGELAIMYCFTFLYFVFAGGGSISVDALVRKKT